MPSDWPTEAQKEQWNRLAEAQRSAAEVCAGLRGKAKMACMAQFTSEEAQDGDE